MNLDIFSGDGNNSPFGTGVKSTFLPGELEFLYDKKRQIEMQI